MAAISGSGRIPTACRIVTLPLNCSVPIQIVVGAIYRPGVQQHEVSDKTIVELPQRKITFMVPHECTNLKYLLLGFFSRDDEKPSARKVGPVEELHQLKELWLEPYDSVIFECEE